MEALQAIIWDFDGTLVDSEPYWASVERSMVAAHGVHWTDADMQQKVGQHARISAQQVADAIGKPHEGEAVMEELLARVAERITNHMPYMPGALELFEEAAQAGIRQCIVSASNHEILDAARPCLPSSLEFIVTADDVTCPKPDPEAYTLAFQQLHLHPTQCVILEDSVAGSTAGLAAGGIVVGVPQHSTLEPHPRMQILHDGLAGVGLSEVSQMWRSLKEQG